MRILFMGLVCLAYSSGSFAAKKVESGCEKILPPESSAPSGLGGLRGALQARSQKEELKTKAAKWIYGDRASTLMNARSDSYPSQIAWANFMSYSDGKLQQSDFEKELKKASDLFVGWLRQTIEEQKHRFIDNEKSRNRRQLSEAYVVNFALDERVPEKLAMSTLFAAYLVDGSEILQRAIAWKISRAVNPQSYHWQLADQIYEKGRLNKEASDNIRRTYLPKDERVDRYSALHAKEEIANNSLSAAAGFLEAWPNDANGASVQMIYSIVNHFIRSRLKVEDQVWDTVGGLYIHSIESALNCIRSDYSRRFGIAMESDGNFEVEKMPLLALLKPGVVIQKAMQGDLSDGRFEFLIRAMMALQSGSTDIDHVMEVQVRHELAEGLLSHDLAKNEPVLALADKYPAFGEWATQVIHRGK